ncbi:hypothetical protein MLD38_005788 [Melastoma candidum]|uniref:Uncharacterized protein n=1 Tax=Melastoma candidum TaxID=119954 RepID=A0ACB9RPI6_9MYRT|nr:hypothetical protein MLD38_005788 [Melastoma candidum]
MAIHLWKSRIRHTFYHWNRNDDRSKSQGDEELGHGQIKRVFQRRVKSMLKDPVVRDLDQSSEVGGSVSLFPEMSSLKTNPQHAGEEPQAALSTSQDDLHTLKPSSLGNEGTSREVTLVPETGETLSSKDAKDVPIVEAVATTAIAPTLVAGSSSGELACEGVTRENVSHGDLIEGSFGNGFGEEPVDCSGATSEDPPNAADQLCIDFEFLLSFLRAALDGVIHSPLVTADQFFACRLI